MSLETAGLETLGDYFDGVDTRFELGKVEAALAVRGSLPLKSGFPIGDEDASGGNSSVGGVLHLTHDALVVSPWEYSRIGTSNIKMKTNSGSDLDTLRPAFKNVGSKLS